MKCPYCGCDSDKVIDSREGKEGQAIRRRRECIECKKRYTTYEQIEEILPMVVKKDGRRELFDRRKILAGIRKACEKRPVSSENIDKVISSIEKQVLKKFRKEVSSTEVGELVMKHLHQLDEIAYVRFASVYRQFKDVGQFVDEIKRLVSRAPSKYK